MPYYYMATSVSTEAVAGRKNHRLQQCRLYKSSPRLGSSLAIIFIYIYECFSDVYTIQQTIDGLFNRRAYH